MSSSRSAFWLTTATCGVATASRDTCGRLLVDVQDLHPRAFKIERALHGLHDSDDVQPELRVATWV